MSSATRSPKDTRTITASQLDAAVTTEGARGVVPVRRPGRILLGVLVGLVALFAVISISGNPAFQWDVVGDYLFSSKILDGLVLTIWLTAASTVLSFLIGTLLAVMRLSPNRVLQAMAWAYIWFFRSVPLLVQLLFWFNIGYLYPKISLGIPFGPQWFSIDSSRAHHERRRRGDRPDHP